MALLKVVTVDKAKEELERRFSGLRMDTETIPVSRAFDRFLAEPAVPAHPVPHFPRSTMDGYAVRGLETAGASDTVPVLLKSAGDVEMGREPEFVLQPGETAYVPTGGMIPEGADAVVMVEYSEVLGNEIALVNPVAPGMNIIPPGHDMKEGQIVLQPGKRLGSADLGILSAMGLSDVKVYRKPSAVILSTGDELTAPSAHLEQGKVRDINTLTISAEAERMGYRVIETGIITDHREKLSEAVKKAIDEADVLFISGGSSAGKKDYTMEVFNSMGRPGCFVHGIAFNPGKPTILADADGFPLVGLPGHPVSSLMVFRIIGKHLLYLLNGAAVPPSPWFSARLTENVHASPGKDTYRLVDLRTSDSGEYEAVPIHGESGMITTLSRAVGHIIIDRDSEGLPSGSIVRVYPL